MKVSSTQVKCPKGSADDMFEVNRCLEQENNKSCGELNAPDDLASGFVILLSFINEVRTLYKLISDKIDIQYHDKPLIKLNNIGYATDCI